MQSTRGGRRTLYKYWNTQGQVKVMTMEVVGRDVGCIKHYSLSNWVLHCCRDNLSSGLLL